MFKSKYSKMCENKIINCVLEAFIIIVALAVAMIVFWNVFTYAVPTGSWMNLVSGKSMYPTMRNGQIVFSDSTEFDKGDIVTVYVPEHAAKQNTKYEDKILIKRIVGVPGDRVVINKDGVYINDSLIIENYLTQEAKQKTYNPNGCNSVLLGENEYFIMGDNRGASYDSRNFGVVNKDDMLYKQSAKPTKNFYIKTILLIIAFVLNVFLYSLVEFVLKELVCLITYGKKNINNKSDDQNDNIQNKLNETVTSKGDN